MALTPSQFFALTPGELIDQFSGWLWRRERELLSLAWQTAHLMNASGRYKENITAEKLAGFKITTVLNVDEPSPEEIAAHAKAEFKELKERFIDILPRLELPKADKIKVEL